jgi:uncharacterized alkaline shock family protein YloU
MGVRLDGAKLQCGALPLELLDQVAERGTGLRSPHQASCPYCQFALGELERAWQLVERLRREDVRLPAGLLGRIMQQVWAEVEEWYLELEHRRGLTRIPSSVLASLAYWAATGVPGISEVRMVKARRPGDGEGGQLAFDLELVVQYGHSAAQVAEAVRERVTARLLLLTSVAVGAIEVAVVDLNSE